MDDLALSFWLYASQNFGMGMGLGLIATSLLTKSIFAPFIVYGVTINESK